MYYVSFGVNEHDPKGFDSENESESYPKFCLCPKIRVGLVERAPLQQYDTIFRVELIDLNDRGILSPGASKNP
jgi:hypothetical protein